MGALGRANEFRKFIPTLELMQESPMSSVFLQRQKQIVNDYVKKLAHHKISLIPENWYFNSRFVLKTTKTPLFVLTNEIF